MEFEAGRALILVPLEPEAGTAYAERIHMLRQRIDDEFRLIQSNISTLFDAIRLGSIRPRDGGLFVDKLVGLVGGSGGRLSALLVEGNDDGRVRLEQARSAFGIERLAYSLAETGIERPSRPHTLHLAERTVLPDGSLPFRRIELDSVMEYPALDNALIKSVADLERAGFLAGIDPAAYPPALHDHARSLLADLLQGEGDSTAWRKARGAYLDSVGTVLSGAVEAKLLAGYEELLSSGALDEAGREHEAELETEVGTAFAKTGEIYRNLMELRSRLAASFKDSWCIVGPEPQRDRMPSDIWKKPTGPEESALLLNASLTGSWVTVPTGWRAKGAVFIAGVSTAAILAALGLVASFAAGTALAALAFGVTAGVFLAQGIWLNPLWVAFGAAAAAAASLVTLYAGIYRISVTKREPARVDGIQGQTARFAILALRQIWDPDPRDGGCDVNGRDPSATMEGFHRLAVKEITMRGGQVLGSEDSILLAGFSGDHSPADAACAAAAAIIDAAAARNEDWRCGLDSGDCSISPSGSTGCTASGRPVVYARLLSGLAVKYGYNILATDSLVREVGDSWETRRLDALVEKTSGSEETFHSLTRRF